MAEENEHIQKLIAARDRQVEERREVAAVLGQKYERSTTEVNRSRFVTIQNTIEVIERAISHEGYMASKEPKSSWPVALGLGSAHPGPGS
jgi:hypothetical protein